MIQEVNLLTREDAIRRLDNLAREIVALREAFVEEWKEPSTGNDTQAFLKKCEGWEDERSPDEIVSQIYQARTISTRGESAFNEDRA